MTRAVSSRPTLDLSNGAAPACCDSAQHMRPDAAWLAHVRRLAELHKDLADEHSAMADMLEIRLAAAADQSDVGDVVLERAVPAQSLISVGDVAERLSVSPTTIRRWRREKKMPEGVVLGGVIRWRPNDIDAWLEERKR